MLPILRLSLKKITFLILYGSMFLICLSNVQAQSGTGFTYIPTSGNIIGSSTNGFQVSGNFTVEMWMKVTSVNAAWTNIIHIGNTYETGIRLYFFPGSTRLHFKVESAANWNDGCDAVSEIPLNTWTHVAVTGSSSGWGLFVNGVAWPCTPAGGNSMPVPLAQNINFFSSSAGYMSAGVTLNDIRLWKVVRSQVEIISNMFCQSPPQTNLVHYYGGPALNPSLSIAITSGSQIICPGTSVTFTATPLSAGTTPAYQWKKNNINTGTNSPVFTTNSLVNNDIVKCVLTTPTLCGSPAASSNSIGISTMYTWTGAISREWNLPANWSCNMVPTTNDNITIPPVSNQPIIH